jgi:hypothetical protein
MKVWITQYALTSGVLELNASLRSDVHEGLIEVTKLGAFGFQKLYHKPHWHASLEEAQARVRVMIAAKRKSLAKELAKLDELELQYGKAF